MHSKKAAARVATSDSGEGNIAKPNIAHSEKKVNHDPPPDICITCRAHTSCNGAWRKSCKRVKAYNARAEERRINGHGAEIANKIRSSRKRHEGRPGKNGYIPY
ncbi:hypothetical protein [Anaeromassilibacillus senegalensis]|uniref:hypothetical protein n=1 Tax=Anaeromassilibacillus senegalensis TaxID=1673717 RepID=UPI00067FD0D9|nr:hypothetical protein [Anaeromassilibacillus senegalensis]